MGTADYRDKLPGMSISVREGEGPYVIDRRLPPIFERAPGVYHLAARVGTDDPLLFDTPEEARALLEAEVGREVLDSFDWVILPLADTEPRWSATP